MEEKQAGITALITAYARAYHATHAEVKIFDDFLADQFYTPQEHVDFDRNLATLLQLIDPELAATQPDPQTALDLVIQLHNGPITLSRSRYAEDCLAAAIARGVEQYLILGAGFDTFAFRHPELPVQVFEVDHPATQVLKRERVAYAGWTMPANLHLVAVDFNHESLSEALGRSPYDPGKATFVSWLGVTYYLAREVVFNTLGKMAGLVPAGSQVVFDYMDAEAFDAEKAAPRIRLMQNIARMVGEPMKSGFDPQGLAAELGEVGFRMLEDLGPAEIQARYFAGRVDRYRAFEHVHFGRGESGEPRTENR